MHQGNFFHVFVQHCNYHWEMGKRIIEARPITLHALLSSHLVFSSPRRGGYRYDWLATHLGGIRQFFACCLWLWDICRFLSQSFCYGQEKLWLFLNELEVFPCLLFFQNFKSWCLSLRAKLEAYATWKYKPKLTWPYSLSSRCGCLTTSASSSLSTRNHALHLVRRWHRSCEVWWDPTQSPPWDQRFQCLPPMDHWRPDCPYWHSITANVTFWLGMSFGCDSVKVVTFREPLTSAKNMCILALNI